MLSTMAMVGNELTAMLSMPVEALRCRSFCSSAHNEHEKWILILMGMMGRAASYVGPCARIEDLGYEPIVLDECRWSDRYTRPRGLFQDSIARLFDSRGLPDYVFTHSLGWNEGSTLLEYEAIKHQFMIAPAHTPNPNLIWAVRTFRLGIPEPAEEREVQQSLERIARYPKKVTGFYSDEDQVILHDDTLEVLGVETHVIQDLDPEGIGSWRHQTHVGLPSSPLVWKKIGEQVIHL